MAECRRFSRLALLLFVYCTTVETARVVGDVTVSRDLVSTHPRAETSSSFLEGGEDTDLELIPGDDVEKALEASKALWRHAEIKDCLQHEELPVEGAPSQSSLVLRVWELELKHEIFARLEGSLLTYVKHELGAFVSKQAALHREVARVEQAELRQLKEILEGQYDFLYDVKKEACLHEATPRLEAREAAVEAELTAGCRGTCSKSSAFGVQECKEGKDQQFCPEGTRCGCHFSSQQGLATLVGAATYVLSWSTMAFLVPGGAVMPGPTEISMLVSFLVASKAEGCRCMPSSCAWDAARQTCAPRPAKGARNPFQAKLPYLGQVCAHKSEGLLGQIANSTGWEVMTQCDLRACLPEDGHAIGQVGKGTYNCQLRGANASLFPSISERMQTYAEMFPSRNWIVRTYADDKDYWTPVYDGNGKIDGYIKKTHAT